MSKVLVIDDSDLISRLLTEALSESGFEVHVASDANQGYAAAMEFMPDVILLDVQLPDVAGTDLIRIIKGREALRHIPIIMITGTHHQTQYKVKAFQDGADDYILKPFEMPELIERVKACIRRHEPRAAPAPTPIRTPAPAPVDPRPAVAAAPSMTVAQIVSTLLFTPKKFPAAEHFPGGISLAYVLALLGLTLGGLAASAGTSVKAVAAGLAVFGFWGLLVSIVVIACSLSGITMNWKDGSRLISLAGLPLLLKAAAALITTVVTSLSPFYFTAGPALFVESTTGWLNRLDLYEIWAVYLLFLLLRKRPRSTRNMALGITAVVWIAAILAAAGLSKFGAQP